ncbi:MAG: ammonium transporter [Gemmataceae bacterium]|nr:ammonium transporter [Gemmataceae bacterium]
MQIYERLTKLRFLVLLAALAAASVSQPATSWSQEPTTTATESEAESAEAPADAATSMPADAETEAPAEEEAAPAPAPLTTGDIKVMLDTLWVMITAFLVFFMNLGFACVESGMCRAKNAVNILSKNFIVFAVTTIGFWVLGWGLMFGDGTGFVGQKGLLLLSGEDNSPATVADYKGVYSAINWTGVPLYAKFFFQLVFAGTAATIVSGAVAERIKYLSFIVFSFVMAICIYPICGHWIWGGGWLYSRGFVDFAGSTVVHSVGGWAALTGVYILGPRIGKYGPDGKINAIPGHNFTAATIGCFVLWLGWFGFNPGSTMAADPAAICDVALTTNMAAAAGTLSATLVAWLMLGKPDLGMTLNGCLAGLVAITAPCAFVSVGASAIIGAIAGALVVCGVMFFDRARADDPVGATSVHLLNGVFGTICVGLFAKPELLSRSGNTAQKAGLFYGGGADQLITQLTGVVSCGAYVLVVSAAAWLVIKALMGLRVSAEEETEGLDIGEHGHEAYHGFQFVTTD